MKSLAEKFAKDFNLPGNQNESPSFIQALRRAAKAGFIAGYRAAEQSVQADEPIVSIDRCACPKEPVECQWYSGNPAHR